LDLLVLFAGAVAVGLDLPLVLLLPILLLQLPGLGPPSPQWLSLASSGPAALGAVLFAGGALAGWVPGMRGVWVALHAVAALPAAGLLAWMLLPPDPPVHSLLLVAGAVVVTACVQAVRVGARLLDRILPWRPAARRPILREAAEDGGTLLLLVLLLSFPPGAGFVAGLGAVALLWRGRPALRAARFLPTLGRGVVAHLTRAGTGWQEEAALPAWSRRAAAPSIGGWDGPGEAGRGSAPGGLRGARAALAGPTGVGLFRSGWILARDEAVVFLFRTLAGARVVELRPTDEEGLVSPPPLWGRIVPVDPPAGPGVLLLPLDGPRGLDTGFSRFDGPRGKGEREGFDRSERRL
jgi:hypothetical protein